MRHEGLILWLTGPVGSGKGALADEINNYLLDLGCKVELLAQKVINESLNNEKTSSDNELDAYYRRILFVCNLLARNDVIAIAVTNSIVRDLFGELRSMTSEPFIQIGVSERSTLQSEAKHEGSFIDAEVIVDLGSETIKQSRRKVVATLQQLNLFPHFEGEEYSAADEEAIKKRLADLGYL